MRAGTKRTVLRGTAIGVQWLCLTIALGSLVMRAETSFESLVSPHLGTAPVFIGGFIAALLLGLTVENIRYMASLVLLMCIIAAAFIGVLSYAPVVEGNILRTTALDNFVMQRSLVVALLLTMGAVPGAAAGNLLGGFLSVRQEISPHPDWLEDADERPWWEQRHDVSNEQHPS